MFKPLVGRETLYEMVDTLEECSISVYEIKEGNTSDREVLACIDSKECLSYYTTDGKLYLFNRKSITRVDPCGLTVFPGVLESFIPLGVSRGYYATTSFVYRAGRPGYYSIKVRRMDGTLATEYTSSEPVPGKSSYLRYQDQDYLINTLTHKLRITDLATGLTFREEPLRVGERTFIYSHLVPSDTGAYVACVTETQVAVVDLDSIIKMSKPRVVCIVSADSYYERVEVVSIVKDSVYVRLIHVDQLDVDKLEGLVARLKVPELVC